MTGTFRSLRNYNYRLWAMGAIVSNVGTWVQRVAQDWMVLTELTHRNATAVGIVTALQFAPQVLLLPLTGFAADRIDRRKLLLATKLASASVTGPDLGLSDALATALGVSVDVLRPYLIDAGTIQDEAEGQKLSFDLKSK